jgi:hypothetical protein
MKRSLFLAIACVALTGVAARNASAGFVPLPSTLDQFVGSSNGSNFTTVTASNETDTFSNFSYTTSPIGTPPTPANISMQAYLPGQIESGITFSGNFFAAAGTTVDYHLQFFVTAGAGGLLNDASLSMASNVLPGGSVSIGETITDVATGKVIGHLSVFDISSASKIQDFINFNGVTQILVQKDIQINGGTTGSGVSIINQGFSSTAVPEPASMALLGIGMTGFLAFRRFFKKTSVA